MFGTARARPQPPAVNIDREEEPLQPGLAVEPGAEEDQRVERDHRHPERVVPDAAPDEQHDVGEAKNDRGDLERAHPSARSHSPASNPTSNPPGCSTTGRLISEGCASISLCAL